MNEMSVKNQSLGELCAFCFHIACQNLYDILCFQFLESYDILCFQFLESKRSWIRRSVINSRPFISSPTSSPRETYHSSAVVFSLNQNRAGG